MSTNNQAAAPTLRPLRLGFLALTDSAPLVAAQELGLFAHHGLRVQLTREAGWATVRDKIVFGELDAAPAPAPMLWAAQLGLGCAPADVCTGLVLNLHGNAITLSNRLHAAGVRDAATLRTEALRRRGENKLTFGVVFPFSTHHLQLCQWLRAAGLDVEKDVHIAIVPPAQMFRNLAAGTLDGYCAGEPWGSVAVQCNEGWCPAWSAALSPGHVEKVLLVRDDFARSRAAEHAALIAALATAAAWCDEPQHRGQLAEMLASPVYLNLPARAIAPALLGRFACGHGRTESVPDFHVFSRGDAGAPTAARAASLQSELVAAGLVPRSLAGPGLPRRLFREDLYREAIPTSIPMHQTTPSSSAGHSSPLNRRQFLTRSATLAGTAALWAALGNKSWAATAGSASEAPEVTDLNFGMIALTDCSPIVIAHEKGFFKKYGINSKVTKGANWAAIRDNLSTGSIQATHMLLGMPLASTMGLAGSPKKPMVIPWILNRNGQAITLKAEWKGKVGADPKALKPFVDQASKLGEPLTFAQTFPPGTHAMWIRYYLAAGGINPDKDVTLITIPPPQMVANMKIGKMDGYCVGEPWNARAIADGIGFTAVTTQDMWKDHPEKVCAFTEEFAEKNPKTVKAVLKALHEASVWLDVMENRPEQCDIVSKATYINCQKEIILGRLQGKLDYGDGRTKQDELYMHYSKRNCNYPQAKYAKWFLSQYRRWGMVTGAPDYDGVAKRVMRADLYEEAMKEIGYAHGGADHTPETLFDGITFDPANPEAYATSFAVKNLKG